MNNLKRKVSLILSVILIALSIFPLGMSLATVNTVTSMDVTMDGKTIKNGGTYEVKGGEKIEAIAQSPNGVDFIGYYYNGVTEIKDFDGNKLSITVPTNPAGTELDLRIEAVDSKNNQTGWYKFILKYPAVDDLSLSAKMDGVSLVSGKSYDVKGGETVTVKAKSSNGVASIGYYFEGKTEITNVFSDTATITIPKYADGTKTKLHIAATDKANNASDWLSYTLNYKKDTSSVVDVKMTVKMDGIELKAGKTYSVNGGEKVVANASSVNGIDFIGYYFVGKTEIVDVNSDTLTFDIPAYEEGSTVKMRIEAVDKKNNKTGWFDVTLEYAKIEDSDLDILPWEKENKDLESLAIALRNDSESSKANKNVYALGEKVTYYVDFKNGGKKIKDEVKITLELPLDFEVISSDGGSVDYNKGLITWTYPNGMDEEYEGTKTVEVKYKAFSKKSVDSMKIYPVATISKAGKVADESAVINYIYRDEDTVITDTHEPYMYGDANATTFRPDATITRAEGALVLTRILLGQSAIDNVKVTSVYPDLDQTYLEAQKAIIAATSYGIINGYTDGYYRPNQTMTRAEFMKIIAKFIELNAEDDGIKGLEVKNIEDSVKLYKDPVLRYAVNGTTVSNHWALEEVTLLVRLNMTAVSSKEKNLRLDEGITRAEVAQLVNFFLLRAPAEVNSRTNTAFSDVSRKHELFADIVEATRKAHDFTITEDGTEIAEY